jgi:hypothetical protein
MPKTRNLNLKGAGHGTAIVVRVTTRSSKNEVVGIGPEGVVKIRLSAAPVDGKANQALIELLAGFFDLPKSSVEIVSGLSSREKLVSLLNIDPQNVQKKLEEI